MNTREKNSGRAFEKNFENSLRKNFGHKLTLICLLLGTLVARTCFSSTDDLPMVSLSQFSLGNHWTWTYYTNGDLNRIHSTEKYLVVGKKGSSITFEIQSHFGNATEFAPRARFQVDLAQCYEAFRIAARKTPFGISFYPWMDGKWSRTPFSNSSNAFEEKFNCNPAIHKKRNAQYETRFETAKVEGVTENLFQQWPRNQQSQIRSFYFMNRVGLEGVAFRKEFNPGTPSYYEMRLTDWGVVH